MKTNDPQKRSIQLSENLDFDFDSEFEVNLNEFDDFLRESNPMMDEDNDFTFDF